MMTTFHKNYIPDKIVSFTKGAPDIVINRCKYISINGETKALNDDVKKKILAVNNSFAKDALRVLALAYREYNSLPKNISSETIEDEMIFVGLVGMIDPPRPEAKEAILKCKGAGIKPIMITGDYKETAFAISKELGIAKSMKEVVVGQELDEMSDRELKEVVKNTSVYARVTPEHKVRIVSALKSNGEIVAMTGDGVNDSMALKKADIGISMGITGTDVANLLLVAVIYVPVLQPVFHTVSLGLIDWGIIGTFAFFPLLISEIYKALFIRRNLQEAKYGFESKIDIKTNN